MSAAARSTGIAITNPLILYRALVATKRIDPDPAQHRLAIHLQKLYDRLKDYEPIVEYNQRLTQISRALGSTPAHPALHDAASARPKSGGVLASLFEQKRDKESMALTRVLTSHEEVISMDSPQGLMLHGEVGTGKSMLIDLFADCLPNRKKKRWHFTTFMLEVLSKLEYLRRSRQTIIPSSLGEQDDYSLLWLARDMISTSPILFLDEFQLPDRAASKIMTNLMTCFFHLGGVLIATSNRMPEELAKAAGMEFTAAPPPSRMDSVRWRLGLKAPSASSSGIHAGTSDFAKFLDVLRARCEVWQMEGGQDYRRREAEQTSHESLGDDAEHILKTQGFQGLEEISAGNVGLGYEQSRTVHLELDGEQIAPKSTASVLPKQFLLKPSTTTSTDHHTAFTSNLQAAEKFAFPDASDQPIPWTPSHITVYSRRVSIPRQHNNVASFTFSELCITSLGPADYITLASTYHTLMVTDVPVLTLLQKNEARRFITLLDALYEARCKLLITAEAGPDELFFPEQARARANGNEGEETVSQDQTLAETISDVYQDATAPFRPNISSYDPGASAPAEPDFTHARLAGTLSNDQLEDNPPNTPQRKAGEGAGRGDSIYGLDTGEDQSLDTLRQRLAQQRSGPNFQDAGIFTGEDEKFAYKRARSRLWEMCGKRWWERSGEWWNPLEQGIRRWERQIDMSASGAVEGLDEVVGRSPGEGLKSETLLDGSADKVIYNWGKNVDPATRKNSVGSSTESSSAASAPQTPKSSKSSTDVTSSTGSTSPFRVSTEPPPKIPWTHMWGFMKWGKKAGAWGKGVEGLEERDVERRRRKEQSSIPGQDDDRRGKKS